MQESELVDDWHAVASRLWMKDTAVTRTSPEIIKKELWDPLEKESFSLRSLVALESLQVLERSVSEFAIHHCFSADTNQIPMADLYRRCLEPPCPTSSFRRRCQASGKPPYLG